MMIGRLSVASAIVAVAAAGVAGAAGGLVPSHPGETEMIEAFEANSGPHPGFRRNHAKGLCLTGWFDSNGAGVRLSRARVFEPGRVPVFGRFSLAGGRPAVADGMNAVRSMSLHLSLPNGESWRTAMNDTPVFPVRDAQGFYDNLVAIRSDPATGKPDPAKVKAFLEAHPESARALALIKAHPMSSGFANATYNSLNAFRFIDAEGRSIPVRWSMTPVDAFEQQAVQRPEGRDYLFDALVARLQQGPIQWQLRITIGQPGDPTHDATIAWPSDRETVDVGTLTVVAVESEAAGNCRDVNFDPLMLPSGIAPSDDPLIAARSAVYAASVARRGAEPKSPSAVQVGNRKE